MLSNLTKLRMEFRKKAMRDKSDRLAIVGRDLLITLCGELETANKTSGKDLTDVAIFKKVKSYIATAEENMKNGMDKESCTIEIDILTAFLNEHMPKQLTPGELNEAIQAAILEVDAQTMKDMGKVMGIMNKNHSGLFDGGQVSQIVKSRLQ